MMNIIDCTQSFIMPMPVYPGDPESSLEQVASIEKETFTDHRLCTNMHVGTHMDAPLHMIKNGQKIYELDLQRFIGKGIVLDARGKKLIDRSVITTSIDEGSIVLIYTGFGEKYRTKDYYNGYPELTPEFSEAMVDANVRLVGMDILGPDYDSPWVNHNILLGNGIYILENLTNLNLLLEIEHFEVIALPMKLDADAAPVRVIARY